MKKIEYSLGDTVEFFWDDISIDPSWQSQSEIDESPDDIKCKTVGYFINAGPRVTTIAGISGVHTSDVNAVMCIPTGCITEHRKLS